MNTEQNQPRYHGFTCPNCGGHRFGSFKWHEKMGGKYPHMTFIGRCHENTYTNNDCTFEWVRDDPVQESACMYKQSKEEWMAEWEKTKQLFTKQKGDPNARESF